MNVVVTIFALMIIDKIDRKKLMIIGNIGMVASLILLAVLIGTLGLDSSFGAWIIVACLALFIIFFAFTWGPILWVMLPELFPMVSSALRIGQVFLIFAAIGIGALIFVIKYLPETRGRSLEEIEAELRKRTSAKEVKQ